MKNINLNLAYVLTKLRHRASISQEDLAEKAGVHRTYVSQIERAQKCPTLQILNKIANALNMPISEIIKEMEEYELHKK